MHHSGVGRAAAESAIEVDGAKRLFRVSRSTYTDPQLFEAEMDAIFARCWLFVGHDSELAKPGDFLTRKVAKRPVIFLRDKDGRVRCFLNVCPHRGAQVCRHRAGNAKAFSCLYHGWTFENTGHCIRIAEPTLYAPDFNDGGRNDLAPVPRFEEYRGFWFLNYDRAACGLAEYLGNAREYIDRVVDQSEQGLKVVGEVQEYSMRANWKMLAENSTDILHVEALHPTYLDLIRTNSGGQITRGRMDGESIDLGNGHAVVEREATYGRPIAQWISIWGDEAKVEIDAIYARLVSRFGEERANKMARYSRNLLVFPNLVINDIMSLTVRTFQPVAVDYMEVSAWAIAPAEEVGKPAMGRRLSNFLEFLGPGGFATPDDVEALESCQRAFGAWREAAWNDLSMGFGATPDDLRGETKAEVPQRAFWRGWRERLLKST
jgi:p-cumate 2,3-dioxygenase alpha subunit